MTDLADTKAAVIEATTRHKAGLMAENTIRNLHYVTEHAHQGVTFSGTAAVCGAGPSLNHAIPVLRERAGQVPVMAVNTAGPALHAAGIAIDVLVCVESLDLSRHIRASGKPGLVVLDLSAHPNAWAAAIESGARVAWICDQGMGTHLAYELGVRPHMSGGFALSSALELARIGGASEIVLCGADLGYPSGHAYANGAGWYGYSVERDGDRLKFSGRPDRDEAHQANGVPAIPRDRPLFDVPAWGGGTIPTVYDFVDQRDWIAAWHTAFAPRLDNCSVGGARIGNDELAAVNPGVGEVMPRDRLRVAEGTRHVDCGDDCAPGRWVTNAKAQDWIRHQCTIAKRLGAFFANEEPWPDSEAMATPIPFVLAVAIHDMYMAKDAHRAGMLTEGQGIQVQYGIIRAAAERVEGMLAT